MKLLVYAALLMVGLYLRVTIKAWKTGFAMLRKGKTGAEVEKLFSDSHRNAKRAAFLFWGLIMVMAWLGIRQPYF